MKVSRAEIASRAEERKITVQRQRAASRGLELALLIAASLIVGTGLWLVYAAKTHDAADVEKSTLNLNSLSGPQQLIPGLGMMPEPHDQEVAANRIFQAVQEGAHFENDGAILRLRTPDKKRVLTSTEFALLKPTLRVRDLSTFRRKFLLWTIPIFRGVFRGSLRLAIPQIHRRQALPADHDAALRHRYDSDDQPARSFARHVDVHGLRAGRAVGLSRADRVQHPGL